MPELNFADTIAALQSRLTALEAYVNQVDYVDPLLSGYDHGGLDGLAGNDDHPQYLREDGGTMVGNLILNNQPVAAMEAATKQYVDRMGLLLPLVMVPNLRGLWLAGGFDGVSVYDASGAGRTMTVTGALTAGVQGLTPYVTFGGTNDYLYLLDEAAVDVLTGFSIMAWVNSDDFGVDAGILNKWKSATNGRAYVLRITNTTGIPMLRISSDGAAGTIKDIAASSACTVATWHCIQAYFSPSTEIGIRVDQEAWATNVDTIPAAVFNSSDNLRIGENDYDAAKRFDGKMASVWLSGSALATTTFDELYEAQSVLFA